MISALRFFCIFLRLWQAEQLSHTLLTSGTDWDGAALCSTCYFFFQRSGIAGLGCLGVYSQHIIE